MNSPRQGKDLPLTRRDIERASQQERFAYAELFTRLHQESRIAQKEIAERANVTPRTIRNIQQGLVVPQADKLIALFIALGFNLDGDPNADISATLAVIAPIIRRIEPAFRDAAVEDAVEVLTGHALEHPNLAMLPNVAQIRKRVPSSVEDLESKRPRSLDLAEIAADARDLKETDLLAPGEHPSD
ncbi:MAG TPA: helix-turn-helix transcriptional regulator [Rhodoglobus sp.]|jgi:transcriptional regulator with XRE-family HTH domain|nr:helix-turn-helix transcriptional regulator [Rhodoglobus sp.]